jgi:hypothetical protein
VRRQSSKLAFNMQRKVRCTICDSITVRSARRRTAKKRMTHSSHSAYSWVGPSGPGRKISEGFLWRQSSKNLGSVALAHEPADHLLPVLISNSDPA